MSKHRFSYDGFGINDANDEYKQRILSFTGSQSGTERDEIGALIEAAPEMLEALKHCLRCLETCDADDVAEEIYFTKAAIAKAEAVSEKVAL